MLGPLTGTDQQGVPLSHYDIGGNDENGWDVPATIMLFLTNAPSMLRDQALVHAGQSGSPRNTYILPMNLHLQEPHVRCSCHSTVSP